jgi:hypothetical protein
VPFASPEEAREAAKKSAEARRLKRELAEVSGELDPWEVLRGIAGDKKVPAYSRTQAAKALMAQPAPEAEAEWRSSVQVRPDYEPPTWREVLLVAKAAGAL